MGTTAKTPGKKHYQGASTALYSYGIRVHFMAVDYQVPDTWYSCVIRQVSNHTRIRGACMYVAVTVTRRDYRMPGSP